MNRRRLAAGLTLAAVLLGIWWLIAPESSDLSLQEREQLLALARRQLVGSTTGEGMLTVDETQLPKSFLRPASCFVTLLGDAKSLRGCMIDQFEPHEPLYRNVLRNTLLAATADERFTPVLASELPALRIEISILTEPTRLSYADVDDLLSALTPGADGVILRADGQLSSYLPSVWEIFPEPTDFLSQLCQKAGLPADRWSTLPPVEIETYRVERFAESVDDD